MIPKWLLEQYPLLSRSDVLCTGSQQQAEGISQKLSKNLENKVPMKEPRSDPDWERLSQTLNTILNRKVD